MRAQLLLTALGFTLASSAIAQDDARLEFFEKKIRPLLVDHCHTCHSADTKPSGNLRVDDRNGLLAGGNNGPAIVPGKPAESLLLRRVKQADGKRRMPLEAGALSDAQIADLTRWIQDGAAWPALRVPASLTRPKPHYEKLKKEHWALQPLKEPAVPQVRKTDWPLDPIDNFLLAGLERANLEPVADADKAQLLRRLTFDLTGLPPTPPELDAFERDGSSDALPRVVDRLLASKGFAEHWGRHWLDVARYGESTGPSRNVPYPHAWRYRDYVIAAVDADVPYDRFITEQIAGDLLPSPTPAERDRLLAATGFLALGVKDVNQRFKVRFLMDNVDEQIDVVSRSVLALTVSCARCHDHKFDPVPTSDYYALAGIFTSTDNCAGVRNKMGGGGLDYYDPSMLVRMSSTSAPPPKDKVDRLTAQATEAKKAFEQLKGTKEGLTKGPDGKPKQFHLRVKAEKLQAELAALNDPAGGAVAHGVLDSANPKDTEIRIRGEAEKLGPVVPRGFLSALDVPGAPKIDPKHSGRLELAQWLVGPGNPLAPRVFVNRVWKHLFAEGLVNSVDNFGVMGAAPSHPELLDHLALRFQRDGQSLKKLVRLLVLTRAYRLGSTATPAHLSADPGNRLVWRHSPRRLQAEEFRDTLLAVAGKLDRSPLAGSPVMTLRMVEMQDDGREARGIRASADDSNRRGVYLPLIRVVMPRALEAFDPADTTLVTGRRDATTVPGQALFVLNSTFVRRQSLALANRVLADVGAGDEKESQPRAAVRAGDEDRLREVWRLTLGRQPSPDEVARAREFLSQIESDPGALVSNDTAEPKRPPAAKAKAKAKKNEPAVKDKLDPDSIDPPVAAAEADLPKPRDARSAAWMTLVQAIFASAEFRYVR